MRKFVIILAFVVALFMIASNTSASWVSGYYRSDGNWVNGYYRSEPNYWKWDNYSWDGDWSDSVNDRSWYRDFGYDPEPFDTKYPNYNYWDSYSYYNHDYDYGYNYDYWK